MQQTDLTLKEIMDQLESRTSPYPLCLLVNELGTIAMETQSPDEADEATAKLCEVLQNGGDKNEQFAAYGHLKLFLGYRPGVKDAVSAFEADPAKADIVRKFTENY